MTVSTITPLRDRVVCERLPIVNRTSIFTLKETSLTDTIIPLKVVAHGPECRSVEVGMVVGVGNRRLIDFCKPYNDDGKTFHIVHEADIDGVFDDF